MTQTQQLLLSLVAQSLFGLHTSVESTPEILREAKDQAVSALVSQDYRAMAQNIRVHHAHAQVTEILHGIPFTTIKGYASAYYYPDPCCRGMGDVDVIVPPRYYQQAADLLQQAGWQQCQESCDRHDGFKKNNIKLELHREVKGVPNGIGGLKTDHADAEASVKAALSDLYSTSVTVDTQCGPIVMPDAFHHGLIMLLHVAGHIYNDAGIGLRHLCDWAVYVNRINLQQYREAYLRFGLWDFACQLTALCSRYLGLPTQSWAGEWPADFLADFIDDILSGGNFGKKEKTRCAAFELTKKSPAQKATEHYHIKHCIFIPFFVVLLTVRYCILFVIGKRKFITPSTFVGASKRLKLVRQFKLFEKQ